MKDGHSQGFDTARAPLVFGSAVWIALVIALASTGLPDALGRPSEPLQRGAGVHSSLPTATPEGYRLVDAAVAQVGITTSYEVAYVPLDYPGGDVPLESGVCTDVIVRAFRGIGIDLQSGVHEDMAAHPEEYPQRWGHARPDSNIDHRRVSNLERYFTRRGMELPVSPMGVDYRPGDIVTWTFAGYPHIGIVSAKPALTGAHYEIVHNIGRGVRVEDCLFLMEITGHYRWR